MLLASIVEVAVKLLAFSIAKSPNLPFVPTAPLKAISPLAASVRLLVSPVSLLIVLLKTILPVLNVAFSVRVTGLFKVKLPSVKIPLATKTF